MWYLVHLTVVPDGDGRVVESALTLNRAVATQWVQFIKVAPDGSVPFAYGLAKVLAGDHAAIAALPSVVPLPQGNLDATLTDAQIAEVNAHAAKVGRSFMKRTAPRTNTVRDVIRVFGFAIEPVFGNEVP